MLAAVSAPEKDVGLGTAYERWAIYRLLTRWLTPAPATVLEGPLDGMAGMPGLHSLPLAQAGAVVTVVSAEADALDRVRRVYRRAALESRLETVVDVRPPERQYEVVVAFNVVHRVPDWRAHLRSLARSASRYLVVFVTHPGSYGAWLRRGLRLFEPVREPALFDHDACRPEVMRDALQEHGQVVAERFVDCPWWPDLFVSPGETLLSGSLRRARVGARFPSTSSTPYDWGPDSFPFAGGPIPSALARALRRHPNFEDAPAPMAGWFAHHRAFLVRRPPSAG